MSHRLNENLIANLSGHYTKGKGYYEEFKDDQDFTIYGLADAVFGAETVTSTDLIRRRWQSFLTLLSKLQKQPIYVVVQNFFSRNVLVVHFGHKNSARLVAVTFF